MVSQVVSKYSLAPVAKILEEKLGKPVEDPALFAGMHVGSVACSIDVLLVQGSLAHDFLVDSLVGSRILVVALGNDIVLQLTGVVLTDS